MDVELVFRLAQSSDLALLLAFMREFYAIDGYQFEEPEAREALLRLIRDDSLGRVWLLTLGDEPIGYLVVAFGYSLEYRGRDAFIDELFVVAAQRGHGVGRRAVDFAVEQCRALGVRALHLEVERGNAAGQALYRRAGFVDHDRLLMTRPIDD